METRPQPHSARSCDLALRAVGAARGCPEGGASCQGVGRPGLGALPSVTTYPWGVRLGPATHWLWVPGSWRGDPSPTAQRALLRAGFARFGTGTRAPQGRHLLPGCGASAVGRSLTPDRPSFGCAAGARYPLAVGAADVGVATLHQPHSARSCELALRAVRAARGRRKEGRLLPGFGVSGVGRSATPDRPSLGSAAGARYGLAVGAGSVGVGTSKCNKGSLTHPLALVQSNHLLESLKSFLSILGERRHFRSTHFFLTSHNIA